MIGLYISVVVRSKYKVILRSSDRFCRVDSNLLLERAEILYSIRPALYYIKVKKYPGRNYPDFYTFNDNAIADVIDVYSDSETAGALVALSA